MIGEVGRLRETRPIGRYCQLRLRKTVGTATWVMVRWVPEKIALQGKPIGFRQDRTFKWSDGWLCLHTPHVVVRPRVHASWDDRRISPPAAAEAVVDILPAYISGGHIFDDRDGAW